MKIFKNKEWRESHIKLLIHIAHLDGKLTADEISFISSLATLYEIDNEFVEDEINSIREQSTESSDRILKLFEKTLEEQQKRCLLQDSIALSCVDGIFSDEEIAFVNELSCKLGLDEDVTHQILDLNVQSLHLHKQLAKALLI